MSTVLSILLFIYMGLCMWMFIDCVLNELDHAERRRWALGMSLILPILAPMYYFQRYRPRHTRHLPDQESEHGS